MANLKNIADVPVVESAEGLNLIVNDNGTAKQIAARAVGAQADFAVTDETNPAFIKNKAFAQADWAVTDESNPAFIKNKPVEEWDLDMSLIISYNSDEDGFIPSHTVNYVADYALIKEKIVNGINPKLKISCQEQVSPSVDAPYAYAIYPPRYISIVPAGATPWNETQEVVSFNLETGFTPLMFMILEDGSINKVEL